MKKYILSVIAFAFGVFSAFSQQTGSTERLAFSKENLKEITNGETVYKSLIRNAEKEMSKTLTPVTDKTIVAVSGDKHDYVSMGPYWWPDPSKPDGLPYIRKDGQRNPEVGKLDRLKIDVLTKSVRALTYAYYFSKDDKYAQKAVDHLQLWFLNKKTKMNPNMEYGQMIPGRNEGKGRAEGIIDTYAFVEMVDCIKILSTSRPMSAKDYAGLKQWFSDYLDWLLTSKIGEEEGKANNNHGTAYDVQVAAYALFADRKDVAEKTINDFMADRLFKQIEPDGSQPLELARTIAMHYSIFNIDHAMDMFDLAKTIGIDLYSSTSTDGRSVSKAIEFILPYLGRPQSEFPYKQIKEWDLNQEKLCWLLRRSTYFEPNTSYNELFDKYCRTKDTDTRWLFYAK